MTGRVLRMTMNVAQDDREGVLDANRENMSVNHRYKKWLSFVEVVLKTGE